MKYIAGGLGSNFRGKLGSIVGSKNYSIDFLRKLNVPRDPKTALQLSKRSNFYTIAKAWQLVTAPNLILWKNLADAIPFTNSLSQTYYLTAFQMFSFCNLNMMQNGYVLNLTPGPLINNNFPSLTGTNVSIITTPGAIDIQLNLPAIPAGVMSIIVMATGILAQVSASQKVLDIYLLRTQLLLTVAVS